MYGQRYVEERAQISLLQGEVAKGRHEVEAYVNAHFKTDSSVISSRPAVSGDRGDSSVISKLPIQTDDRPAVKIEPDATMEAEEAWVEVTIKDESVRKEG
jgi:hypothetical protein